MSGAADMGAFLLTAGDPVHKLHPEFPSRAAARQGTDPTDGPPSPSVRISAEVPVREASRAR